MWIIAQGAEEAEPWTAVRSERTTRARVLTTPPHPRFDGNSTIPLPTLQATGYSATRVCRANATPLSTKKSHSRSTLTRPPSAASKFTTPVVHSKIPRLHTISSSYLQQGPIAYLWSNTSHYHAHAHKRNAPQTPRAGKPRGETYPARGQRHSSPRLRYEASLDKRAHAPSP